MPYFKFHLLLGILGMNDCGYKKQNRQKNKKNQFEVKSKFDHQQFDN